jgi:hypothetical protein
MLSLLILLSCATPSESWPRALALAEAARSEQSEAGWASPLWIDVGRECSRVMPWHAEFAEARALRRAIEDGRLAARDQSS